MTISSKTPVVCTLKYSKEENVHIYGLRSTAWYAVDNNAASVYKITFWNRHAPVTMPADIVIVELDSIHVYINDCGRIRRDKDGNAMVTRRLVVLCPKTREGLYMKGYDPLSIVKGYVNRYMIPTSWSYDEYFVKQV